MEDSIGQGANLIAAVFALVYFLAADAVVLRFYHAAFWTGSHIAKALLEDVVQTGIVIGKLLMQIVDGVARRLHTTSVADLLHDVKG